MRSNHELEQDICILRIRVGKLERIVEETATYLAKAAEEIQKGAKQ